MSLRASQTFGFEPSWNQQDARLVEGARRGDRAAFGELIARHQNLVRSITYAITGDLGKSEDVAQETFVIAWRHLGGLRDPGHFRSWLRQTARNLALNSLRARGGEPSDLVFIDEQAEIPSREPSPLDRMISREDERLVRRALERVPVLYRIPLLLYYWERQSVDKVAEALGLSENNVHQRLARARRMLQPYVSRRLAGLLERRPGGKAFALGVMAALRPSHDAGTPVEGKALLARATFGAAVLLTIAAAVAIVSPSRPQERPAAPPAWRGAALAPSPLGRRFSSAVPLPASGLVVRGEPLPSILGFDFEDGALPASFTMGHVVPGPERTGSQYAVMGTVAARWGDPITAVRFITMDLRYRASLVVKFDYWVAHDGGEAISLCVWNNDEHCNFCRAVEEVVHERWTTVALPLSNLTPAKSPWPEASLCLSSLAPVPSPGGMEPGDDIPRMTIEGGRVGGRPFLVDNLSVIDDPIPL